MSAADSEQVEKGGQQPPSRRSAFLMPSAHWDAAYESQPGRKRLQKGYRHPRSVPFLADMLAWVPAEFRGCGINADGRQGASAGARRVRFLEVGCAPGRFLTYFHRVWGWEVAGIELSEAGMARTQELLGANGVPGRLLHGDVLELDPADYPEERFDVVGSFGLVEHFVDPLPCYHAMVDWLRPGGVLLVTVPYLFGRHGELLQERDPECFQGHQLYRSADLAGHCEAAGLAVLGHDFVGGASWPLPYGKDVTGPWPRVANRAVRMSNRLLRQLGSWQGHSVRIERYMRYVGCVARKPE